jgi:acetyl esterase/lipase
MNRNEFLKTLAAATASLLLPRWSWGAGSYPTDVKTFTYKTVDGLDIKLDVYGADPKVRKPVIVHPHGGALVGGSRKSMPVLLDPKSDYAVINFDYRLAPESKLPVLMEDVQDAFRWIHEKGPELLNIDPGKIVVIGESAGGYLSLMSGFWMKPRPQAVISHCGYGDIVGPWITKPNDYYLSKGRVTKEEAYAEIGSKPIAERKAWVEKYYFYVRQNGIWPQEVTGHNPATEPKWFDRYCPVRNVTADYPPTLLIHGTDDTDVAYEAAAGMDKALTRAKVQHKLISIPGGGHGLVGVSDVLKAHIMEEASAFAKQYAS